MNNNILLIILNGKFPNLGTVSLEYLFILLLILITTILYFVYTKDFLKNILNIIFNFIDKYYYILIFLILLTWIFNYFWFQHNFLNIFIIRIFILINLMVLNNFLKNKNFFSFLEKENIIFEKIILPNSRFNKVLIILRQYHILLLVICFFSNFIVIFLSSTSDIYINLIKIFFFISIIFGFLYFLQFFTYIGGYIRKIRINHNLKHKHNMFMFVRTFPKIIVTPEGVKICVECLKGVLPLIMGVEIAGKLYNGGLMAVSPWREHRLNKMFPMDRTGKWTELKAAKALQYRAMGIPHDEIYNTPPVDPVEIPTEVPVKGYDTGYIPASKHGKL